MSARPAPSRYVRIILAGPVTLLLAALVAVLAGFWMASDPTRTILRYPTGDQIYNTTMAFPPVLIALFFFACLDRSLKRVVAVMLVVGLLCIAPLLAAIEASARPRGEPPRAAAGPPSRI